MFLMMTTGAIEFFCDRCYKFFWRNCYDEHMKRNNDLIKSGAKIKCELFRKIYEKNYNCRLKCTFFHVPNNLIDWKDHKTSKFI